jgi:hypothetical protein
MVTAKWSKSWDNCPVPRDPGDPELDAFADELISEILAEEAAVKHTNT